MTRWPEALAASLVGLVLAGHVAAVILVGPYGWDDGAITVAFARSLSVGGEMALTLASERVEGSSTLLTVLLLSLVVPVSEQAFALQILISQLFTILALAGTLAVLYVLIRDDVPSVAGRLVLLALFAALPPHLVEAINGMEMALFGLLLTLFVAADRASPVAALALIPLILATRFEGAFYIGVALVGLLLFDPERRRRHAGLLVALFVIFGLFTLWRWLYFGDVVPNTVWAKMQPPYRSELSLWHSFREKLNGPGAMIATGAPLLLVAGALWLVLPVNGVLRRPTLWLLVGFFPRESLEGIIGDG